jgi:hypothetical protein
MPAPPPPPAGGYAGRFGFAIKPEVVQWIPVACLAVALVLTFFSWCGAYPGGHAIYTQSAWGSFGAGFASDPVGDDLLKLESPLKDNIRSTWLMFFYLILLPVTLVAATFSVLAPRLNLRLPPYVEALFPKRFMLVAILTAFLLVLVGQQSLRGFGLERALIGRVDEKYAEKLKSEKLPDKIKAAQIEYDIAVGSMRVRQTVWMTLALLCHVGASGSAALMAWLVSRDNRPHPRVEFMY